MTSLDAFVFISLLVPASSWPSLCKIIPIPPTKASKNTSQLKLDSGKESLYKTHISQGAGYGQTGLFTIPERRNIELLRPPRHYYAAQNDRKKELRFYDGFEIMSAGIISQKQAFETNPTIRLRSRTMVEYMNLLLAALPETFQFLHGGWFVVHIIGIAVVGYIGYKIGRLKQS
jgi:hypothetical protein